MPHRRAHFVLSSHWDREWYQPFQDYRYRLCEMLEPVFAGLENGQMLGPFQTDGQAILLEDYLEVYPGQRGRLERLAEQRRLIIGPWYVLPDEALVSGESLVRNLRLGRRMAREFHGRPSDAGFVCDLFGHVSQLPQIMAGFGIKAGFIWRGTNDDGASLVKWRGADGAQMLCYRFGMHGYGAYANDVRHATPSGEAYRADVPRDDEQIAKDLDAFIAEQARAIPDGPLLLFDGGDHQGWDQQVYEVLKRRIAKPGKGIELVHSCLDDYLTDLLEYTDAIEATIEGELREPGRDSIDTDNQWLISGVLSSRAPLKQINAYCQTLLCHWAEPLSLLVNELLNRAYPAGFLDVAWRWLMKNHPHDSICGCSVDRVHQDMMFRFSQCQLIGERLRTEAADALAAHVNGELMEDELRVVVFNPLPERLEQTVELTLPIPTHWPQYPSHGEVMHELMFRVCDDTGQELPIQKIDQAWSRARMRISPAMFPQQYHAHEVRVSIPVSIPGVGYTTLRVLAGDLNKHQRVRLDRSLVTAAQSMENESLAVAIEANGTLTLTDKRSGECYPGLLLFEDTADTGDGWYHGQTIGNQTFCSVAGQASVALVADGPHLTTFRIRTVMDLPTHFDKSDHWQRSETLEKMTVDSYVSLRPGSDYVEIETMVDNTIDDHRLRVLMPTGARTAETYLADSVYDVIERPIALRDDNHLYRECELETKPQQTWTAVNDGRRGLAVISEGLYESAVRDLPDRPIALTLFRATHKTVFTDGEPDGQLRQTMRFRYWVRPISGQIDLARLCKLGQRLACGVYPSYMHAKDVAMHRNDKRRLPVRAGCLEVEGKVVMSALEQRDGQPELRLFNPTVEPATATIHWPELLPDDRLPASCLPVDFEGRPTGEPITVHQRYCKLVLAPKQIVTLRLE